MEAKVKSELLKLIQTKFPGMGAEIDIDWEVAEISFKAGIKEVVDWIKTERKCKYINDVTYYPVYEKALESQLKEWGIKEEK